MAEDVGADIKDFNLGLAVLAMLMDAEVIPQPDRDALRRRFPPSAEDLSQLELDRDFDEDDLDEDGFGKHAEPDEDDWALVFNSTLAEHLASIPLTQDQLDTLRELYSPTDAPYDLQSLLYPLWDGEDEQFMIRDLRGIERCRNLEVVDLGTCLVGDLSPLLALPKLKQLRVTWSYETPKRSAIKAKNEPIIAALKQRKVKVEVQWP